MARIIRAACACILVLFAASGVAAHPHVFIEATAEVEFSDDRPVGVSTRWEFDNFFSRMILVDFAGTTEAPLSRKDIESIRTGAFVNLEAYNYFLHILVDGREVPITRVEGFAAEVDGKKLIYSFRVPLPQPEGPDSREIASAREVAVGIYDDSYYSDFEYPSNPVRAVGAVPATAEVESRERPDRTYYYDLIVPRMFHIRWN